MLATGTNLIGPLFFLHSSLASTDEDDGLPIFFTNVCALLQTCGDVKFELEEVHPLLDRNTQ